MQITFKTHIYAHTSKHGKNLSTKTFDFLGHLFYKLL
jgi:hypothetical protein